MRKRLKVWENAFYSETSKSSAQRVRVRDEAEEISGSGTRNLRTGVLSSYLKFVLGNDATTYDLPP